MKRFPILAALLLSLLLTACGSPAPAEQGIVGQDAPDFTLDDALGGQTSLAEYSGQPVLLYFHMAVG